MNQIKRPASAGVSRKTFAPEPVLFYPNFKSTEIPKELSDEAVIKYNSRPSSASCVNRIFKKESNIKQSKEIDKTKCFLRISTSPLPYARSPSPSPSSKIITSNKNSTNSRPTSASRSAVSIAKSSSTFKIGLTNENFREVIEKNMLEQKKGRPPFQKTFTTQLGEESEDENGLSSRQEYSGDLKHKNPRPRSAAVLSTRPWSSSTSSSSQRYSKKSRVTETPRFSGSLSNEKTERPILSVSQPKFSRVSELTSPHGLSRTSLPTSESIEKKVASTPRKYTNLKTTFVTQQYSSASSFDSSASMKKSTSASSVKNPSQSNTASNRTTPCIEEASDSDSDSEELEVKPYEVDMSVLKIEITKKKTDEKKPALSRTGSFISSRSSTPSSTPTNFNATTNQLTITAALNEKSQPSSKTTTPQNKTPSSSTSNRRQSVLQSSAPFSTETFGLGEEFESALMDSTAVLKTHILALPKTKNQLQRSPSSKKMGSTQIRNDFLLSRNKFNTTSFAKAAERQNKAYTNLVKADKQKNTQAETEEMIDSTVTSIQLMEKDIVYSAADAPITLHEDESVRIDLNIPIIDTKGGSDQKPKEKLTESKTFQFSNITKSMNQVMDNWGNNIQTSEEKQVFDSVINDAQAIEKMADLKQSVEIISGYGSKAAMKTAKKNSDEISRYIIEQNPSFFGFEVSKTFLDDFTQKKQVETEDDIINIIKDYKQDITQAKNDTKSSDSEEEVHFSKKAAEHRPLTLGKEKRRKINQKILDERIAEIKKYSWKYTELENRVKEIKKEMKEKEKKLNIQDHIKLNTARQSFESIQAKKEHVKDKFSDRRERALVTFQEQEKKRSEILENKFEEKEKRRQNASSEKMSKLYKQKMWKLQKSWFPVVKFSLFITQLSEPILRERQIRKHNADVEWAHCIMKKRLLPYILKRREQRQKAALEVIRKNWLIYVINFRVRRRKRAANLIESFINDINKTSRIVRAVSRFVSAVKKVQRFIKHFLFKRRIHLYILNEQYKRCERDLIKSIAKEDFQEVRFKIVDVLKKMKETAFFEEPVNATETRAIQRKQSNSPTHSGHSGFSDDTSGVRRTKLAVTEAKKNLKAVQKFVMDELRDSSTTKSETKTNSPRGRKFSFLSTADAVLKGSDKWNKGLDDFPYLIHIIEQGSLKNDIILKVGRMLRITPRKRSTKTKDEIRMRIVREDLARRMNQIQVEEKENEKRQERNVIALNEQNKKFTEIHKRSVLNTDITNQIIAKQIDIIEEEEEIERARLELQKKKSVTFVPAFYMENLVRKGLELTFREDSGSPLVETSKSPKKKSSRVRSRRSSFKDSLAEERENDFLEYEKLLQDLQ